MSTITVKAKDLRPGETIIASRGVTGGFTVDPDGITSADRNQLRVQCDDDQVVFWFDEYEDVVIEDRAAIANYKPVRAYFFTNEFGTGHLTNFATAAAARVAANQWLCESSDCFPRAFVEILDGRHGERMEHIRPGEYSYNPLADISLKRYVPNPVLERHFQMAGAVDQARVERLTSIKGRGFRVVDSVLFIHAFLSAAE